MNAILRYLYCGQYFTDKKVCVSVLCSYCHSHQRVKYSLQVVSVDQTQQPISFQTRFYLPRSLHVDGDDMETVAAELTGPAASLADPLQQAVLVGVTH